jgi:crotonobetainyl-CoA:carnitine CoA-transferase CaiB-like acyl-CoA transferase
VDQLKSLKVLELASVLAGPSVGQFFAELGAEVIKVENSNTGGDVTRTWKLAGEKTDDRSAYFCSVNWGKRSIAVDLNSDTGIQTVHKLARKSDIVIVSYKPGDADKLRVDYNTLSKLNPKLIYGQITGYGSANPKVGYDAIIQAETGFMFLNGLPGGPSLKMPVALMDVLAGHHLKEGILLALLERFSTGIGKLVEVSLIQAAVSSLVNQATNWLVAGKLPEKHGSAHPNIAPYGDVFLTQDNLELLLAVGNDRQFSDLCDILDVPQLSKDTRFSTNVSRVQHRNELNAILSSRICEWKGDDLVVKINKQKIPGGLVQNIDRVLEMPEVQQTLIVHGSLKSIRNYVGNSSEGLNLLPPPKFGEHTESILISLDDE